jgi:hypothetical protein
MSLTHTGIPESERPSDAIDIFGYLAPPTVQPLVKAALLQVKPDGWAQTTHNKLGQQLMAFFEESITQSVRLGAHGLTIFGLESTGVASLSIDTQSSNKQKLTGALRGIASVHAKAPNPCRMATLALSAPDFQILSQLAEMIAGLCGAGAPALELRWAFLCCPALAKALTDALIDRVIRIATWDESLWPPAKIKDEHFAFPELFGTTEFPVPHAEPGRLGPQEYTGVQVLAAALHFMLTGIWLATSVPNNISHKALCIPDSVFVV